MKTITQIFIFVVLGTSCLVGCSSNIDGIGSKIAGSLIEFFSLSSSNSFLLGDILNEVKVVDFEQLKTVVSTLTGIVIVFTGNLKSQTRQEA